MSKKISNVYYNSLKHKRRFINIGLLLLLLTLNSCFDILEEINLNDDGSGKITLTFNLSKSKTKIASLKLLDSVNGHKVPDENDVETFLDEAILHLQTEKGISNVQKKTDFDNYIFSLSCEFTSITNIDKVINDLMAKQKIKPFHSSYKYDKEGKVFSLNYNYKSESKSQYNKLKENDKKVFNDAYYISIYRFENEIISYTNTNAKLSKSKKAMMLKSSALDLINGKTNLTNQIHLNK